MEVLKQFLPLDPAAAGEPGERPFFLFQLTFFDCGGVAIGVCFSHQVADCVSVLALVDAWASTSRREPPADGLGFSFDLHIYFPPRVSLPRVPPTVLGEKFVTRRFVFDTHKLMILKELASASASTSSFQPVNNPTRVELVSGFIWRSFLKGGGGSADIKVRAAYHLVNLRPRFNPPRVLDNVLGNGIMFAFAVADSGCGDIVEEGYEELIRRLRCSIKRIDENYITQARYGDEYVNDRIRFFGKGDHVESCSFSGWTRFPLYDVDFGWGNPVWCCTTALPSKNLTVLMSSRGGEDIEAWVNMNEHNLEMLQTQFQLISTMHS